MTTIYVMLVIWSGGTAGLDKTHMVYGSREACEESLALLLANSKGDVEESSCKAMRVTRGVPVPIGEGLTFTPY